MAFVVNVHTKALTTAVVASTPFAHSVEHRLALLATRYERIEAAITALKKQKKVAAPIQRGSAVLALAGVDTTATPQLAGDLAPSPQDTPDVTRVKTALASLGATTALLKWVPSDYYTRPLAARRDLLGAPGTTYLCKSILLENTHCVTADCANRSNSRYYLAVFQYVERFDSEKLMRFVKSLNAGIGKSKFNFRLADPVAAQELTGFGYNAVAPFGTNVAIPVIVSDKIGALPAGYFWMGGGHVDCKLRIGFEEFRTLTSAFVADISNPLSEEELASIRD